MSDETGRRFSWFWVFIVIGLIRLAGSAWLGNGTTRKAPPAPLGGLALQGRQIPVVLPPGPVAGANGEPYVVLFRYPARPATSPARPAASPARPAAQAPAAGEMDALLERARKVVGKPGTLVPPLAPPPRAPPRP